MATTNEQIADSMGKLTEAVNSLKNLTVSNHEEVRKRLLNTDDHIRTLYKKVDGKDLPPGPNGSLPPVASKRDPRVDEEVITPIPLERHVSNHDTDLEAVEGRLIVLESKTDRIASHVTKTHDMQTAQTKAMGIGLSFFKYLASKDGIRAIGVVIAALAALLAAFNTSYANWQKFSKSP